MSEEKCQRCVECEGAEEHHWVFPPNHDIARNLVFFSCEHCPATCEAIDGEHDFEPSGIVADPPLTCADEGFS